mgnify:CR=1 FL=1
MGLSVLSYVNYTFSLILTYMCVVHIYRPVIIIIYCHIIQTFLKCWNLKSGCILIMLYIRIICSHSKVTLLYMICIHVLCIFPVQLNLVFSCADKLSQDQCHIGSYTKITWDSSKRNGFIEFMENSSQFLRNTVDEIVSANIGLNDGIDLISKHTYNISSNMFGETK